MKYFCKNSERNGTCYIEFQKGDIAADKHWLNSSLFIGDEEMGSIGLIEAIKSVLSQYDPYGKPITVNQEQWKQISELCNNPFGKKAIEKINY